MAKFEMRNLAQNLSSVSFGVCFDESPVWIGKFYKIAKNGQKQTVIAYYSQLIKPFLAMSVIIGFISLNMPSVTSFIGVP